MQQLFQTVDLSEIKKIMKTKTDKTKRTVNIITMGCSKNLVDSERLKTQIEAGDIEVKHDSPNVEETVIINTCGFIGPAKQESIDVILDAVKAKEDGSIKNLFVMGCLSERYADELRDEIPEVDQYFGVNSLPEIVEQLNVDYRTDLLGERNITTPSHYAYLKISEGCNRKCSFCAIPLIRGKHVSRPIEELVKETEYLVSRGVKEIILIAQDLSFYGYDLYKEYRLADLITKLSEIEKLEWIRLHYAYPANFPEGIIEVIKQNPKVCKYIDIPIQHVSDKMLNIMRRGHSSEATKALINKLRNEIPDIVIRTTLLVGHPGETKSDFEELKEFVKETQFERLGVFPYSEEEDTWSAINYKDEISEKEKENRAEQIMSIQQNISAEKNYKFIGKKLKVIIDRYENEYYIGRSEYDSPEVDNEVLIYKKDGDLVVGNFYWVNITEAHDYDLIGTLNEK